MGGFGVEPGKVQQDSGIDSGEGFGCFAAEPGQVQQGSEKVPVKFLEGFGATLGGFGAEPGQIQ